MKKFLFTSIWSEEISQNQLKVVCNETNFYSTKSPIKRLKSLSSRGCLTSNTQSWLRNVLNCPCPGLKKQLHKFDNIICCNLSRDGKNSLFFWRKSRLFLVCCQLNLVGFLVAFWLKKSPFSLLFGLTITDFS